MRLPNNCTCKNIEWSSFNIETIPQNCQSVWDLIANGMTKGVFQLESGLGKSYCKKLKPESIEHLAALTSILRPGCLEAVDERGVNMAELFCRRKNGIESSTSIHDALNPILDYTYDIMIYQEQLIKTVRATANFNDNEADALRKAVGKKIMEKITEVGNLYISKAIEYGIITEEDAHKIWDIIKKSGRYLFNKSHASQYGIWAYRTAYIKSHCPLAFYTSWICYANEKNNDWQEEIAALIEDSKLFDIEVEPPDIRAADFKCCTDGKRVLFGLIDIKGLGEVTTNQILEAVKACPKPLEKLTWLEFLCYIGTKLSASLVEKLIKSGACRMFNRSRTIMLTEMRYWFELDKNEHQWITDRLEQFPDMISAFKALSRPRQKKKDKEYTGPYGGCKSTRTEEKVKSMVIALENPASSMEDSPEWIVNLEKDLLGIALSYSLTDEIPACSTCKEVWQGRTGLLSLGVEVKNIKEHICKNGKSEGMPMGFLTVSDSSGCLDDVVCFADSYAKYSPLLMEGALLRIVGEKDGKGSFIVKNIMEAAI